MLIKVHVAFVFGLQTFKLKDFSKIYQLKGLKPKNKGHTNFYECCDLTKKVYLMYERRSVTLQNCHGASHLWLSKYFLADQSLKYLLQETLILLKDNFFSSICINFWTKKHKRFCFINPGSVISK